MHGVRPCVHSCAKRKGEVKSLWVHLAFLFPKLTVDAISKASDEPHM